MSRDSPKDAVDNCSKKDPSLHLISSCFSGKALLERDSLDEAIKHLQRANDLAKEQKLNFGDDIAIQLRIARKKRWNIQEEKRIQQEIELQTYLNRLILEDRDRKIDDLRKTGEDVDLQVLTVHSVLLVFLT